MNEVVTTEEDYAITQAAVATVSAPDLDYLPAKLTRQCPGIAIVGAGGISRAHLGAYKDAGYDVRCICDSNIERAKERRDAYYPSASVCDDISEVLSDPSISVVDITTHPSDRVALIEQTLTSGRHVLSQKPFVLSLDIGERLADLADENGVLLAVNQNGRWAPHFAWMREAVRTGQIGDLTSVHAQVHWDHTWTKGTPFEHVSDLVFYDFAIHWFDFLASIAGDRVRRVYATQVVGRGQNMEQPLFTQAMVELEGGQASLVFDAGVPYGPSDATYISGTEGSLKSVGPDLGDQNVKLYTDAGVASPSLQGTWFNDGFHGAMADLLSSIETGQRPLNDARANHRSLEICFAAIASSRQGVPVDVGSVRELP